MLTALINCLIVTGDSEGRILPNSHLLIDNGIIKEISSDDPRNIISSAEKVIDLSGKVVFPGFICSHSHLYSSHMRGAPLDIVPPHTFDEILDRVWWPLDEALSVDDAYSTALYSVYMMARSGVTCYIDTYSGPNSITNVLDYISRATQEVGIRGLIGFEVTERNTSEEGFDGLKENERFLSTNDPEETLVHGIIPVHASFTVSDDLLRASKELSDKFDAPLTIHTSEGKVDLEHNLEKYGKRTIERLHDVGFLGERTVLAHCVHVDDNEIDLIKETNSKV
ncbi:MAG: amidohydrolase family protein, partial [Candidatus Kariarchaeaceae archaeon]